jgi:thiol-disulfide isomerase/thioredoxin
MKTSKLIACAFIVCVFIVGSFFSAFAQEHSNITVLKGKVADYKGQGYLLLINNAKTGIQYDTITVKNDKTFYIEIETAKNTERLLFLEYLGDNSSVIKCYIIPGDTLNVDITGEVKDVTLMGETSQRYVSTAVFTGKAKKESEYLNIPPYYGYIFKNADGSPVTFKNYISQIVSQQNMLRNKLKGTCKEFLVRETQKIDDMLSQEAFVYARRLIRDGNDPSKDADFMTFVNSINLNDPANISSNGYSTLAGDAVWFKLLINPDLYKDEPAGARYYCFIRDSISNQTVREFLADNHMSMSLSIGNNTDLAHIFSIYKTISSTSEQFKKNEVIYNNLSKLLPGVKATNFEMQDVNGNTVKFLDVIGKGKLTYIDFWATWCGPCCMEIPYVEKLVEKYKHNPKIEFISISLDKDLKKWHQKLEKDNPAWRQFVIPDNFESEFAKEYNITAIPRFMIFDGEGKIITINAERPSNPDIENILNKYIK